MSRRSDGFTLIELLIVFCTVAAIAIGARCLYANGVVRGGVAAQAEAEPAPKAEPAKPMAKWTVTQISGAWSGPDVWVIVEETTNRQWLLSHHGVPVEIRP